MGSTHDVINIPDFAVCRKFGKLSIMSFESLGLKGKETFDSQFQNPERLELAGGIAKVVDIYPETPSNEAPILLAPAWACTTEVYKPTFKEIIQEERRVISLDHPRRGGDMKDIPREQTEEFSQEELRKAYNLLGILEKKGIIKADVIAHSEGAINAVIAAVLHPERFQNLFLFNPAGLIGKDTFGRLLQGFAGQGKRAESLKAKGAWEEIGVSETEKEVGAAAAKEAVKYLAENPVRGIKEGMEIAQSDIHTMLRYLHEKGIGVIVMSSVDDPVFPHDRVQENVKADMLDGFLTVRGGHGAMGEHPELYAKAAVKLLKQVEENKRKKASEPIVQGER